MSMVDWWLATNTWLRDQSTCSSPLTCRRAPAPHSNPGAQQRAAMHSGQWRLRSTAWTSSAALIQAAVHASVKANCTALNAVQAKFRSERRGGVDGMSMMSSGGCTGRRIPKGQGMGIGEWGLEKAEAVPLMFRITNPQYRIPRPQGRKKTPQPKI